MAATLYIVGTPIGNLEDITLRALRVLRECDAVVCEDTRVTQKLLSRYELRKPLIACHAHANDRAYQTVFDLLEEGKTLALVSDAGTPAISDPGAYLVAEVRTRFHDEVHIEVVPGPNAVAAALSIAGVYADAYVFLGFPPHKKGRKTFFDELVSSLHTAVFFESTHRIEKALAEIAERVDAQRTVVVARELTKVHEEVVHGSITDVRAHLAAHPDRVRGEFVVILPRIA